MKVSDYIAQRVAEAGIRDVFMVTGGGAMHLDDSFGKSPRLRCTFQHHEQACAMAAEAYARVEQKPACVLVTTGPGAVNALTGCLCAWMESIPVLFLSGQARFETTVRSMGLPLRSTGVQEYEITKSASPMTKYAVMIERKEDVRCCVDRALRLMMSGRRGPVWLDVPLNIQAADIDPDALRPDQDSGDAGELIPPLDPSLVEIILDKLKEAERPVLFGGNGVRSASAVPLFRELSLLLGIPVLTGMSSVDLVPEQWPLYAGRTGMSGGRAGNLTMAGSDLFFSIGSRLSFLQTGYNFKDWAREAYTIVNEIDPYELKKPNLHVSLPVICDAGELLRSLVTSLKERGASGQAPWCAKAAPWLERSLARFRKYPPVTEEEKAPQADGLANIYAFYDALSEQIPEGEPLAVSVGQARMTGTQAFRVKEGGRFYTNSATASMGYGLPCAIGLARAYNRGSASSPAGGQEGSALPASPRTDGQPPHKAGEIAINLCNGEGCMMMNLQELQTIATNRLPVRVFVLCNGGYHSIRQTQMTYFGEPLVGIGPDSGDLGFPPLDKLADTFGFSYGCCPSNETLKEDLSKAMKLPLPALIEVKLTTLQKMEPKPASRKLPDGSMVSSPLEDMAPFLDRKELARELEIPLTESERRE